MTIPKIDFPINIKTTALENTDNKLAEVVQSSEDPLNDSQAFTSSEIDMSLHDYIIGTVVADQHGVITYQFSVDGINFDGEIEEDYNKDEKKSILIQSRGVKAIVVFRNNSGSNQTTFRISVGRKRTSTP